MIESLVPLVSPELDVEVVVRDRDSLVSDYDKFLRSEEMRQAWIQLTSR